MALVRSGPPAVLDVESLRRPRARAPGPSGPAVHDRRPLGDTGLAVRVYRPGPGLRPVVIYVHGGGFVAGDLDSHDRVCRRIALGADAVVVAAEFRRAPEHPGPAAMPTSTALHRPS